jgi:hypothetical protein
MRTTVIPASGGYSRERALVLYSAQRTAAAITEQVSG